jgi:DNA-binding XRE family transcriptional regulator
VIHNRIALFRAERGWSRKELAAMVEVNPQTIGFLERGDYSPSVELALKFARLFGVSVERLFSLDPFPSLADELSGQVRAPSSASAPPFIPEKPLSDLP